VHPDLTIVLDVSENVAVARQLQRGMDADRYERMDGFFHRRVNAGFREIAAGAPERCVVVSADETAEAVYNAVLRAVGDVLAMPGGAASV
jgi:dTMP kinase